jgi:hypothetical protein
MKFADEVESDIKAISPGRQYIAVGRLWQRYIKDAPLRLYDATSGDLLAEQAKGTTIMSVAMNSEETRLVSGTDGNTPSFTVWSLPDLGKLQVCVPADGDPRAITSWSGIVGSQLACMSWQGWGQHVSEGKIYLWDLPGVPRSAEKRDAPVSVSGADGKSETSPEAKRRRK